MQEDHRSPIVGMHLRYDVGTRDAAEGLAIVTARMMLRKTAHVGVGEYDRLLAAAGARNSDWGISLDATTFSVTLPTSHHLLALWMWSDQMGFFAEDQAAFEQAFALSAEERTRKVSGQAMGLGEDLARRELYPAGHPYRVQVGVRDSVAIRTAAEVRELHDALFVPSNATLVLVGDVVASTAIAEVEQYFGSIPRGQHKSFAKLSALAQKRVRLDMAANIEQETVVVSWLAPPEGQSDGALPTLAEVLGGKRSRVLERELGDHRGLVTWARASYVPRTLGSVFRIEARVAPAHTPAEVADALFDFLGQVSASSITEYALTTARTDIAQERRESDETCLGRARALTKAAAPPRPVELTATDLSRALSDDVLSHASVSLLWNRVPGAPVAGEVRARAELP